MTSNSPKNLLFLIKNLIDDKDIDENCNNLIELKTALSSVNSQQLQEVLKEVNISQFCNDLNQFEDQKNIGLIVTIFDVVFDTLPTDYVLNNFQKEIINGLDAKNVEIIELWLKTLNRCLTQELSLNHTICSDLNIESILLKVIQLLSRSETSTAKYCHSIVFQIAKSDDLSEKFFNKSVQNLLIETKRVNDIIRMRVYALLVSIASTSHKTFYRVESFGHFKDILKDLNDSTTTDPLLTLNILQILTDLGSTAFGTQYLYSSDILKTIAERLNDSESDIFGSLLIPGYIKIFGNLASNEPNILDKHPMVLNKLKTLLDNLDPNLMLSAIDGIAIICHKNAGKLIIDKTPEMTEKFMKNITTLIISGSNELKSRALNALSNVLKVNEPDPTSEASAFVQKCFGFLLPNQKMSTLLSLCKEPFLEIKLSALECIRVLASHVWGQKELAAFPGFLEYILDRSSETTKQAKEAKYAVVRELVVSPFISLSFTKEAVLQLRAFYKEGPYYVANETAVSFESA